MLRVRMSILFFGSPDLSAAGEEPGGRVRYQGLDQVVPPHPQTLSTAAAALLTAPSMLIPESSLETKETPRRPVAPSRKAEVARFAPGE